MTLDDTSKLNDREPDLSIGELFGSYRPQLISVIQNTPNQPLTHNQGIDMGSLPDDTPEDELEALRARHINQSQRAKKIEAEQETAAQNERRIYKIRKGIFRKKSQKNHEKRGW